MHRVALLGRHIGAALALGLLSTTAGHVLAQGNPSHTRFEVSFPAAAHAGPITGRLFIIISHTDSMTRFGSEQRVPAEPRQQIGLLGPPFFGRDVERLAPGQSATIDATDLGSPVESLRDIPAGDYFVQALISVYTEFHRADGHVVWMHNDQWEGQRASTSPGNLVSEVRRIHLDPGSGYTIHLETSRVLPPVQIAADTKWVKRVKIQSQVLTRFWGQPIYLGAVILLPRDYETSTLSYPVHYIQGHFSLAAPAGFADDPQQRDVQSVDERQFSSTHRHHVSASDAVLRRLLCREFAKHGPLRRRDHAGVDPLPGVPFQNHPRAVGSIAFGRIHRWVGIIRSPGVPPDFFGGTWSYCPDPLTYSDVGGVNLYHDANAFYKQYEWRREPTLNSRTLQDEVSLTSQQRNYLELVYGTHGRAGAQYDIWEAVFGPVGKDGYFEPLWDHRTGEIHHQVAQYWSDSTDLLHYMQRSWATLGPKIIGKLHVYVGDADTYYLDRGVREVESWMKTTTNPHYEGFFMYGERKPHCWSGPVTTAQRHVEMAEYLLTTKPEGTTAPWWKY